MDFIEMTIETTSDGIDFLTSSLQDLGINGFTIEDSRDFNDFLETVTPHWDYVEESLLDLANAATKVKIYPPDNAGGRTLISAVLAKLDEWKAGDVSNTLGKLSVSFSNVREEDWANEYKKYFKPFPVGERLVIKPSWENYENTEKRVVLEIDPSASFGTGTHETTKLCLLSLEKHVSAGMQVLDIGCGSGILSAAALLLGAAQVCCVDIDENCIKTTRENLERNGFDSSHYDTYCGNAVNDATLFAKITAKSYDLIAANIVADVIIAMRPLFLKCLASGGLLLTSGIIGPRAEEVGTRLVESGFQIKERLALNDWVLYILTL